MSQTTCPACRRENAEDAAYCDQCGQHLSPPAVSPAAGEEDGAPSPDACPACGGKVQDRGDDGGVCLSCGLELVATPDEEDDAEENPVVRALSAAIMAKLRAGMPMEQAVADACRRVLRDDGPAPSSAPEPKPSHAAPGHACPVCGAAADAGQARCPECAVWFSARHAPGPCPRCGETADGGRCECGALLTVPEIAAALEPSVRFLCAACKQPYVTRPEKCPDCGGERILDAGRLRASL